MRTRTRASCHRRGPSSSSGQHWSARDAGSRMALNVLIAVPRRHGFMSPHGHCLWARDCLWRHDQVAFFCSRAVTEGRDVQLVDREGVGLEDHGRACILRIRIMPRLRRHAEQPRARPAPREPREKSAHESREKRCASRKVRDDRR